MEEDPFVKYQNAFQPYQDAFQSIVPPQGVQVAQAPAVAVTPDQASLSRYNKFLVDQNINPNTIGTATIDRNTGQMVVPSIAQEQFAVRQNNQANARQGDLIRAARRAHARGETDKFLEYKQSIRELNNERGRGRGDSYEDRLAYFLAMAQRATPPPRPSANGFS